MNKLPLAGLNILNTRPQLQATALTATIQQLGGNSINLPTITIEPITHHLTPLIPRLHQFDSVIFMSSNAVHHSIPALLNYWNNIPHHLLIGAVGPATATVLAEYGINTTLVPQFPNSEGLLASNALQQVAGRSILIMRGQKGRTLLDDVLKQRGAIVQEIIVYRRHLPQDPSTVTLLSMRSLDIILCTSIECMQNLFTLLGNEASHELCHTPWLCISERVAAQVHAVGVKQIIIAKHGDMLEALCTWAQHQKDSQYG